MLRELTTSVARAAWIRKAAVSTPGLRDLAWRFIAGEDLDAAVQVARALNARGLSATLNYVGTHVRSAAEAIAAGDAAVASLHRIRRDGLRANVSVKLTHLGLDVDEALARAQLARVLDAARATEGFVRIDMEESPYVDRTLRIFDDARRCHGDATVGVVLQAYLRGREGDVGRLASTGAAIRLVKGGYWEDAQVVHRKPAAIDAAYARGLEALLASGARAAVATHDPAMIARARRLAADAGRPPGAFELQLLYGVRPDLAAHATRAGVPVRLYVPYGARWYEYALGCIRRMPAAALKRISARSLAAFPDGAEGG
ncbi:MAG TPA: proline dehydrogenase family protein [Anaeromyxobacteraceae bacterium]|nr:proline dehydrogenase family protein [Anaeromyxobacteraceae bacterium]